TNGSSDYDPNNVQVQEQVFGSGPRRVARPRAIRRALRHKACLAVYGISMAEEKQLQGNVLDRPGFITVAVDGIEWNTVPCRHHVAACFTRGGPCQPSKKSISGLRGGWCDQQQGAPLFGVLAHFAGVQIVER